ncbi:nuclear transport factor 2 family protein [Govanella unica]|uniref:Nuclear transport factor 2 family protein n=1 Tax=Govanella unica TaxID=2975056 RepID=A0A9X3TYH5_9PROT|nr:nuclear transport factor 2 family protein [Govania unica]MDA5193958.1 nuclear transport factor 2 family protein [Govania unica]
MTDTIITQMFRWWNEAYTDPNGFTPEAFSRFYTDDAELIVNGNSRGKGLQALSAHYQRIQAAVPLAQMVLPVDDDFATTDRAFVHCHEQAKRADGTEKLSECFAYAEVRDGKMSVLRVVGYEK